MDRQTKFIHHILPTGHSVSIGYEFSTEKFGEVKIAATFKSEKDKFIEDEAVKNIRKDFAEGEYISVIQEKGESVIKIVMDVFNDTLSLKMPSKWKKFYPKGIQVCGGVNFVTPVMNTAALIAERNNLIAMASALTSKIISNNVSKLKRQAAKQAVEKYIASENKKNINLKKRESHNVRHAKWEASK